MNELYGPDWATLNTLREADEGRRVSARRLREAESRRVELFGAQGDLPRLQDAPRQETETMPAVPLEETPESESPAPEAPDRPLTPRPRAQPTEAPRRPRPLGAVESSTGHTWRISPESSGAHVSQEVGELRMQSSPTTIGKKALQPHDASVESYETYVARLTTYQE